MIKNKLPSDHNQCDIQNEIAREQDISSRGKQKYDLSITTMQMCLVQMIDGRLKQSRPGNARYNVGGMSISEGQKLTPGLSKVDPANIMRKYVSL
mmetsp:Transcript_33231/g.69850  ORF Transcript_33231/g.69850 Transcript_33231/m.69850 type:complete len:95 (-) Transcript_33231:296-580(-)